MTTTLTIAAADFALAGTIPAVGAQFIITPVHVSINSTTDQIVSGKSFGVTVDATGAASTAIPDALAGNGLSIWSTLQGWVTVAVDHGSQNARRASVRLPSKCVPHSEHTIGSAPARRTVFMR